MHPVNRVLSRVGLRLIPTNGQINIPAAFKQEYYRRLEELRKNNRGFGIFKALSYDVGTHPQTYVDFECTFAAQQLAKRSPISILDIGSYRHFIIGLLAHYKVTTLDVRRRNALLDNETVLTCDAKQLDIQSDSFDAIVSLCAIEHFGLGRYGDEFDLDADKKAFNEMIRVLKPGGILVFTTTITRAAASIGFNAHRIYDYDMIKALCNGLSLCEETIFSHRLGGFCSFEEISNSPTVWDIYCGCWTKG